MKRLLAVSVGFSPDRDADAVATAKALGCDAKEISCFSPDRDADAVATPIVSSVADEEYDVSVPTGMQTPSRRRLR